MTRSKAVKELFENTDHYLTYDYNLQIRKETVLEFTKDKSFKAILDMPCGTGAMSVQLLNNTNKLVMIDVSTNMLSIAKASVPNQYINNVETINDDFLKLELQPKQFDLIICLGILAHVDSPEKLLQKLSTLVAPNGFLIIQNTDAHHFYAKLIRLYLGIKKLIKKQTYSLNKVPGIFVEQTLISKGFMLQKTFRYNQSFLGLSNLFSNQKKYNITHRLFGNAAYNKNKKLGSDVTYLFKAITN